MIRTTSARLPLTCQGSRPRSSLRPILARKSTITHFQLDGAVPGAETYSSVETIRLPEEAMRSFAASVVSDLPKQGVDLAWQTSDLPSAHKFITASHKLLISHLPLEVLEQIASFTQDPAAPSALLISGFPLEADVPLTPKARKAASRGNPEVRLPVMEAAILGAARLLGTPSMPAMIAQGNRGGLVSDLIGTHLAFTHKEPLTPHVEFGMFGNKRPDVILLLGVRQDPANECCTLIADNRKLLAALAPEDVTLLRQHQVAMLQPNGSSMMPWSVIMGPDSDPVITLHANVAGPKAGIVGSTDEVTAAYERAILVADRIAERVRVQPGELLLVNQWRCNKGRSAYELTGDGLDWWQLKTYSKQQLWQRPGACDNGALDWPQLVIPGM